MPWKLEWNLEMNNMKNNYIEQFTKHKAVLRAHHSRMHTNEKPFKCQFPSCTFAAKAKRTLVTHMRNNHTDLFKFRCSNCPYTSSIQSSLQYHQKTCQSLLDVKDCWIRYMLHEEYYTLYVKCKFYTSIWFDNSNLNRHDQYIYIRFRSDPMIINIINYTFTAQVSERSLLPCTVFVEWYFTGTWNTLDLTDFSDLGFLYMILFRHARLSPLVL